MNEWEFSVYHLAKELGMLAEDLMERMTAEEFSRWALYYKKLGESSEKAEGKSGNLLEGSMEGLIGSLT